MSTPLLDSFAAYLRMERGLAENTVGVPTSWTLLSSRSGSSFLSTRPHGPRCKSFSPAF